MTNERTIQSTALSRTQPVVEGLLGALRKGAQALENEAAAATALEQAYREANSAAGELKSAIRAEATARAQIAQAERGEKRPLRDAEKAKEVAAGADRRAEQRLARWKAEEATLTEGEKRGKRVDRQWADQAKVKADEARRRAGSAHLAADRAQEASEAACRETRAAQDRARQAALRVRSAKIADAGAKREAEKAEEWAKRWIEESRTALQAEVDAKKTVDRTIGVLKAAMLAEARMAESQASAARSVKSPEVPATETGATTTVGQAIKKLKATVRRSTRIVRPPREAQIRRPPVPDVASVIPAKTERQTVPVHHTRDDLYRGTVRLLVTDPADHKDLSKLRDGLEHVTGLRVVSMGGYPGEGASITVVAERPLPLALRISELDVVEKALKKDSDIEVRLRLPSSV